MVRPRNRLARDWLPAPERRRDRLVLLVVPLLVACGPVIDQLFDRHIVDLGFGLVLGMVVLLIVLALMRAEQRHVRARYEARSAHAVAGALGAIEGGAHVPRVLGDLARQACDILGMERAVVLGRDPEHRGSMQVIAGHGVPGDLAGERFSLGHGVAGQAMVSGERVVVQDYAALPDRVEHSASDGLCAVAAVPIRAGGEVRAALTVGSTTPGRRFANRELEVLERLAAVGGVALEHAETRELLERALQGSVKALAVAVEARDNETGEHSEALVTLARGTAERLGLSERELSDVAAVARLHDVGKIAVPDRILRKRGPLSHDEWEIMKCHTVWGEQIIERVPGLERVARVVRSAHERWDGTGYPDGLSDEQIPLLSRIVFACDAYQAMTADRPYRKALDPGLAKAELREGAGTQFDPRVVDALLATLSEDPQLVGAAGPLA